MEIDYLITHGRVIDGCGNPWQRADVALHNGRIIAIAPPGRIDPRQAAHVVNASGMVVCPGFIDIQSHSIVPLMVDGRCLSKITQGVTTEVMGEAWTPAPFGGLIDAPIPHTPYAPRITEWIKRAQGWTRFAHWLDTYVEMGVSPNVGSFLGAGTLRSYALGMAMRDASADELTLMQRVAADAMADGAFGVSYALIYPPDCYARTPEIVAVCEVIARYGGVYITHIRSEAEQLFLALDEAITVGRQAAIPVEVYHLKAAGRSNWDKMPRALEHINQARAGGVDITADMYPYAASGTGLTAILPPWSAEGGKLFANLADPATRQRIRHNIEHPSGDIEMLGTGREASDIMPVGFERPENKRYAGHRLSEIAAERGQDWIDAAIDLIVSEQQRIGTIFFSMSEANLPSQLQQPWIKISTDAGGVDPAWATEHGPIHPRSYGTYTRVLGKYVREDGVLTLEEAIRKMTSAVANRLGIHNRGRLVPGCYADVVVFDPATVSDRATFADPHQLSIGVRDVWVNGVPVVSGGQHTGAKPGVVVTGPGFR